MRKTDIRDFIWVKFNERREKLQKETKEFFLKELENELLKLVDRFIFADLQQDVRNVIVTAENVRSTFYHSHHGSVWNFVNSLYKFQEDFVKALALDLYSEYAYQIRHNRVNAEYPDIIKKVSKLVKPYYDKLEQLRTLEKEVEVVISKARNGKDAYKTLIALGVDMKDFKDTSTNLPVIRKLSVDVCVLEGSC